MKSKRINKMRFSLTEDDRHAAIRRERAENKCELCGNEDNRNNGKNGGKIILKVIHINNNKNDFAKGNLLCLCQVCRKDISNHSTEALLFIAQMKNENAF